MELRLLAVAQRGLELLRRVLRLTPDVIPDESFVAVAMALVFLVAMLLPLYMGEDWQSHGFWQAALTIFVTFIIIAGSLLIARSAGYRLVQDAK